MEQLRIAAATAEDGQSLERELNPPHISMWQKIKYVAVCMCWVLYYLYYFVFNIRSNMWWFGDVRSKLPTCVKGIALNSGNPKED